MKVRAVLGMAIAIGCATTEEAVRPGPAERVSFAPPAGLAQLERWVERRAVQLSFPDQPDQTIIEIHGGVTEERWKPLPDGGFEISSVVREQGSTRNGVPMPLPLPIAGVAFVHRVDAEGKLVSVEDPAGTAYDLRERITDRRARELLESLLTSEFVTKRVTEGWAARTRNFCELEIMPGATSDALEQQELPVGPPVPLLVRQRALGFEEGEAGRVAVFGLRFAGRGAGWIDAPSVQPLLDALPEGKGTLPVDVKGQGTRLVSKSSCQVVRETARVDGTVPVDRKAAEAQGMHNFPTRIEFRVDREITREALR